MPEESLIVPVTRIAVVEDDLNFLTSLQATLSAANGVTLVAVAHTRAEGLALLQGPESDVLLVDLGLPDGSGIDVIRAAVKQWPKCTVAVSTVFGDEAHVIKSIEAGAMGYLLKGDTPANLVADVRSLMTGGSPISPVIARQILTRYKLQTRRHSTNSQTTDLATSELQVLDLIAKGFTANEIAKLQGVSCNTVQTYIRRVYAKLEVNSKAEAIHEAHARGLIYKGANQRNTD